MSSEGRAGGAAGVPRTGVAGAPRGTAASLWIEGTNTRVNSAWVLAFTTTVDVEALPQLRYNIPRFKDEAHVWRSFAALLSLEPLDMLDCTSKNEAWSRSPLNTGSVKPTYYATTCFAPLLPSSGPPNELPTYGRCGVHEHAEETLGTKTPHFFTLTARGCVVASPRFSVGGKNLGPLGVR